MAQKTLNDITAANWGMSLQGAGEVVEALDDIRQCIAIILTTARGSDPLRPEFGSDIFRYIDQPITTAAPEIVREIIEAISIWETRVRVVKVVHYYEDANLFFEVTVQLVLNGETAELLLEIDRITGDITIGEVGRAHSDGFDTGFN